MSPLIHPTPLHKFPSSSKLFSMIKIATLSITLFSLYPSLSNGQSALKFNGASDIVLFQGVDFLPGDDISASFWFNAQDLSSPAGHATVIMSKSSKNTKDIAMEFRVVKGKAYLRGWVANNLGGSLFFDGKTPLILDRWYHYAITFDNSENTILVYLDGEIDGKVTDANNDFNDDNGDMSIGGWIDGGYNFKGAIDELRIWQCVRTQQQIRDHMKKELLNPEEEPELVAYYQFNESTGSTLPDRSRNRNDGQLKFGTTTWCNSTAPLTGSNAH